LTPHIHLLVPEALWRDDGTVVSSGAPDDAAVTSVLHRTLRQVAADWEGLEATFADSDFEQAQQESLQRPLALADARLPRALHRRVAVANGFSLHADTAVHGHDRQGLERLCRYGARGPFAECRLRRLDDGRYQYTPKRGSPFVVTAEALVKRLVTLVPPPNVHLTSAHGVYAPNSNLRRLVTARPVEAPSPAVVESDVTQKTKLGSNRRLDWATLHRHTWGTDVFRCPCGGVRRIRGLHVGRRDAEARLAQLGLSRGPRAQPPATAPPRQVSLAV
jgi:hypothetical protein